MAGPIAPLISTFKIIDSAKSGKSVSRNRNSNRFILSTCVLVFIKITINHNNLEANVKSSRTGLGLDIVKRLSDAMDIQVSVSSNENGSTFSLEFKS